MFVLGVDTATDHAVVGATADGRGRAGGLGRPGPRRAAAPLGAPAGGDRALCRGGRRLAADRPDRRRHRAGLVHRAADRNRDGPGARPGPGPPARAGRLARGARARNLRGRCPGRRWRCLCSMPAAARSSRRSSTGRRRALAAVRRGAGRAGRASPGAGSSPPGGRRRSATIRRRAGGRRRHGSPARGSGPPSRRTARMCGGGGGSRGARGPDPTPVSETARCKEMA